RRLRRGPRHGRAAAGRRRPRRVLPRRPRGLPPRLRAALPRLPPAPARRRRAPPPVPELGARLHGLRRQDVRGRPRAAPEAAPTRAVVAPLPAGPAVGGPARRRRPAPAHGLGRARGRRRRAAGRVRALGAPRPAHPGAGRAGRRGRAARGGVYGSIGTPDAPVTPGAVTLDAVTLDVVICTYDNARMLDRALAALARQEAPEAARWSVLVVDNNCTDDTAAVVE